MKQKTVMYTLCGICAVLAPLFTNYYSQYLLNLLIIYMLVTLGFNLTLGYAGRFSFANATLFGIGAYCVGLLMRHFSIPFWLSLPMAGVVAGIFGYGLGFIALRLHRYYLAVVTLAFMFLMKFIYIHGGEITYGPSGFDIPNPSVFGYDIVGDKKIYYIVLIISFVLFVILRNIIQSPIGRSFAAIRDNENAAEAMGIDANRATVLAFAISGFVVGIAGGLLGIVIRRVTPDSFGLVELTKHFIMVVLGGLGSIAGSLIGAVLILLLPEVLRGIQEYQEFVFGSLIVVFVLVAPQGLYGLAVDYLPGVSREKLYR